jgi:hypothetical protein
MVIKMTFSVEWYDERGTCIRDMQVSSREEVYKIAREESKNFEGDIRLHSTDYRKTVGLIARFKKGEQVFP